MKYFLSLLLKGIIFCPLTAFADVEIVHFNVGMGDSTLIIDTKSNQTILVDAGNRGMGWKVILPELNKLGFDNLDYFVATHYDADHIGGIDEVVLGGITVDKYIDRGGYTNRTKLTKKGNITQYGEYKELVEQGQHQIIDLSNNCELISLGDTKIYFLTSSGSYVNSIVPCSTGKVEISNKKDNDLSIGMLLVNKNFRYFIGGDLTGGGKKTKDLESKITKSVGNLDVLKLNHHGSSSSSNASFLSALSPEAIIISVGNGGVNKAIYHLPTQDVLDRVDALKSAPKVYLTNKGEGGVSVRGVIVNGHIVVRSNGNSYWVNNHAYKAEDIL